MTHESDSHQPVSELLQEIFVDMECKRYPHVISTDNAGKDQHTMSDTMFELRKDHIPGRRACQTLAALASPWSYLACVQTHGKGVHNRGRSHYYPALAELKVVFARYIASQL